MKPQNVLVPAKFVSLILHLTTTVMIFFSYSDNILTSYPQLTSRSDQSFVGGRVSVLFCNILTLIFISIEIVLHFVGYNMFREVNNFTVSTLHLLGTILQAEYIYQCWNFYTIWYIFLPTSALTLIIESITSISSSLKYRKWN